MNTNNNNHNNRSERSVVFTAFWPEENQQTAEKLIWCFSLSLPNDLKSYPQFFRSQPLSLSVSLSLPLSHDYFCYFYKSLALIYRLDWLKTHTWLGFSHSPIRWRRVLPHKVQQSERKDRNCFGQTDSLLRLLIVSIDRFPFARSLRPEANLFSFFFFCIIHLSFVGQLLVLGGIAPSRLCFAILISLSCWKWWLISLIKRRWPYT